LKFSTKLDNKCCSWEYVHTYNSTGKLLEQPPKVSTALPAKRKCYESNMHACMAYISPLCFIWVQSILLQLSCSKSLNNSSIFRVTNGTSC